MCSALSSTIPLRVLCVRPRASSSSVWLDGEEKARVVWLCRSLFSVRFSLIEQNTIKFTKHYLEKCIFYVDGAVKYIFVCVFYRFAIYLKINIFKNKLFSYVHIAFVDDPESSISGCMRKLLYFIILGQGTIKMFFVYAYMTRQ